MLSVWGCTKKLHSYLMVYTIDLSKSGLKIQRQSRMYAMSLPRVLSCRHIFFSCMSDMRFCLGLGRFMLKWSPTVQLISQDYHLKFLKMLRSAEVYHWSLAGLSGESHDIIVVNIYKKLRLHFVISKVVLFNAFFKFM